MRCLVQYVSSASVTVTNNSIGQISQGFCVLVGFRIGDSHQNLDKMAKKLLQLRTIPDENDKINLSIQDVQGEILLIPQFTLYADTSRGHRPNFSLASPPEESSHLFNHFVKRIKESGLEVYTGEFGTHMQVSLNNNGPITILLEN